MNRPEVWVTGIGARTAAGAGLVGLGEALRNGRSLIRPLPALNGFPGGAVNDLPVERDLRRLDRSGVLFCQAAEEAWRDAALEGNQLDAARVAVIDASSLGPVTAALEAHRTGGDSRPPSLLVRLMPGAGGAAFAARHAAMGPVFHLTAGSAAAACAIGEAWRRVASGEVDVAVAGGGESPLHPEVIAVFRGAGLLAGALDGDEFPVCRPFDLRRNGTLLGEGAGALILESGERARRRGATPRAIVTGYGLSTEAASMFAPDPGGRGVSAAVRAALAGAAPGEVDWIKAHGTGTRLSDRAECAGLADFFGSRSAEIGLTSLKLTLGHTLGASGAVEAVAAILALQGGFVPRSCGTEQVDPGLAAFRVATSVGNGTARLVLLLSEGFGGRCAALALRRA